MRLGHHQPAASDDEGALPEPRHIEVKGRVHGADTITVTTSEILYGLNQKDKFILAIVLVDGEKVDGPHYIRRPFTVRSQTGRQPASTSNLKQFSVSREPHDFGSSEITLWPQQDCCDQESAQAH